MAVQSSVFLENAAFPQIVKNLPAWSVTLKEEHRLKVLKNGMQRKMFGTKTWEIGGLRKLNYEELHNLYHCKTSTG